MMEVAARDFPDDVFKATVHGLVDDGDVRYIRIVPSLRFLLDLDVVLPHDLGYGEATEDGWLFSERDEDLQSYVAGASRKRYDEFDYYRARHDLREYKWSTERVASALKVMVLYVVPELFNDPDFWLPWLQARADHVDERCWDLPTRNYTTYNEDAAECVCREIYQRRCCQSVYGLRSGVNVAVIRYDAWERGCGLEDIKGKYVGYKFVMTSTAPRLVNYHGDDECKFTTVCVRDKWLREGKLTPCEQEERA